MAGRWWRVGAVVVMAAAMVGAGTQPAHAAPPAVGVDGFYTPPSPLPDSEPGDVIRSEPAVAAAPARATRIMYRSTDVHGKPMAVTGTVLQPLTPWTGPGPRPLVSFAEGTQGQGDQCAPSKTLTNPLGYRPVTDIALGYEVPFTHQLLGQGIAVVITDYQGLGTPGTHTYAQPVPEGNAVIDAARAAQRLPGTDIPPDGPVGFYGYSQGGQAAAAAAEQVGSYAKELHVVGTFSGAAPANMYQQLNYADASLATGAIGYYVNGIAADYPQARPVIDAAMNNAGKAMLADVATQCLAESAVTYGFRHTNRYTTSGRSIADELHAHPVTAAILKHDILGRRTPTAPVLLTTGSNDDIADPAAIRQLARDWCDRGATVQLVQSPLPTLLPSVGLGHMLNYPVALAPEITWLRDRFAGRPAPTTCR